MTMGRMKDCKEKEDYQRMKGSQPRKGRLQREGRKITKERKEDYQRKEGRLSRKNKKNLVIIRYNKIF